MSGVTVLGFRHGARVWHRDRRLLGTVRHSGWLGTGVSLAEVRWDGHRVADELELVAPRLASL